MQLPQPQPSLWRQRSFLVLAVVDEAQYNEALLEPRDPKDAMDKTQSGAAHIDCRWQHLWWWEVAGAIVVRFVHVFVIVVSASVSAFAFMFLPRDTSAPAALQSGVHKKKCQLSK